MFQRQCRHRIASIAGLITLLLSLLLSGCSISNLPQSSRSPRAASAPSPQPTVGLINQPISSSGCGQTSTITPGTSADLTIPADSSVSNGVSTRSYRVHVPASYQPDRLMPAILIFHGYSGQAAGMESLTGFSQLDEQQDFLTVYPQGLLFTDGQPIWASAGPIDEGIDDLLFVSNVLNDLQAKFCIDAHRIYATGFSNGGGMANYLACRLSNRIAAFAHVAGNYYATPGGCYPGRSVPILEVHGTADSVVPYAGISASENSQWPLPSIPQWLDGWAYCDRCTTGPTIFLQESNVTGEQWTGCQGNANVVHYRLDGGGHAWPATLASNSGAAVFWNFFQVHPLPGAALVK